MGIAPGTSSIVKSNSRFRGSLKISSGNTSHYFVRIEISSNFNFSLLLIFSSSITVTTKALQPFLTALLSCKVEIFLMAVFQGIPLTFINFPSLFMQVKVLPKQFRTTLCCSNQSYQLTYHMNLKVTH